MTVSRGVWEEDSSLCGGGSALTARGVHLSVLGLQLRRKVGLRHPCWPPGSTLGGAPFINLHTVQVKTCHRGCHESTWDLSGPGHPPGGSAAALLLGGAGQPARPAARPQPGAQGGGLCSAWGFPGSVTPATCRPLPEAPPSVSVFQAPRACTRTHTLLPLQAVHRPRGVTRMEDGSWETWVQGAGSPARPPVPPPSSKQ